MSYSLRIAARVDYDDPTRLFKKLRTKVELGT